MSGATSGATSGPASPEKPPVKRGFDLTINLGHLVIIASTVVGIVGSHYVADYRLAALERQVTTIEAKLDRFTVLIIESAVTAQRVKELERRVDLIEKR